MNTSLTAQAVAAGPPSIAPPSFEGNGWLFLLNLFAWTAGFALCLMLAGKLAIDSWRCLRAPAISPNRDEWRDPIMLWRRIGIFVALGSALLCCGAAYDLWAWNPAHPAQVAAARLTKRVLDPLGIASIGAGLATFFLALPGMTEQLRREPFPISMWTSLPLLKRPMGVVACCFGAALAVVIFR